VRHSANSSEPPEQPVAELGEFPLIARLLALLPQPSPAVLCPAGDDAAVLDAGDGRALLFTADALVEGRHFLPLPSEAMSAEDVGWRAVVASVSDVAAMGGRPTAAVICLALPGKTPLAVAEGVYRGASEAARAYRVDIVGGDTTATDGPLSICVAMLGEAQRERVVLRSGARPGNVLAVTGWPGRAAGGLEALRSGAPRGDPLPQAYLRPHVHAALARAIADQRLATAMMDLSDGIAQDIWRLAERSQVRVVVRGADLPVAADLAERFGEEKARRLVAGGGEDFELLLALPRENFHRLAELAQAHGTQLTAIGEVLEGPPRAELEGVQAAGWDHFPGSPR